MVTGVLKQSLKEMFTPFQLQEERKKRLSRQKCYSKLAERTL